jgi:dipeptidyl aminopeptidase/acylaminoacyl peptidase
MRSTIPWQMIIMAAVWYPLVFSACTVEREVDFMAGTPTIEPADLFGPGRYAPDAGAYAQIGSCGSPGTAPDGGHVLFTSNLGGVKQLYRLTERNWPLQLTFLPEGIDWYAPSYDGNLAVIGASPKGSGNPRLLLVDILSGRIRRLTDNPAATYGSIVWDRDNRSIFLRSNEENERDFKLYRMDLATAELTKVLDVTGQNYWEDISLDGRWMIFSRGNPATDNALYLYDLSTGDTTRLTIAGSPARYQFVRFDAQGKRLFLTSDANGRDLMLRGAIDIDTKELSFPEASSPWNVDYLALSPSREIMAWVTNRDGYSRIDLSDLKTGKELPAPRLIGLVSEPTLAESSPMLFVFESPTQAPGIWRWDWQKEKSDPLTETAYAGIDSTRFVEPKPITYGSFDGVQIQAWRYLPTGYSGGPIPFIIDLHDGPAGQSRPAFNPTIQFLVSRGYGILAPNVRGSGGFGRRFEALDDYQFRGNAAKDVKAGIDWLIQNGYTRPDLAGIAGTGYGGYLVLTCIAEYPQAFAAAWDQGGITDFTVGLENLSPWRKDAIAAEYGPLSDGRFLKSISPVGKVDRIQTPLMIAHGAEDPWAPIDQVRRFVEAMQNRGAVVGFLPFPEEGHEIKQLAARRVLLTAMGDFFDAHLKGNQSDTLKTR